jgi:hypothetical protein
MARLREVVPRGIRVARQRYRQLAGAVLAADRTGGGVRVIYQDQRCLLAEVLP